MHDRCRRAQVKGWARACFFALPVAAFAVTAWAAWQTSLIRRPSPDSLTLALAGPLPALDPFLPRGTVESQLLDLIYPPLLRLDAEGQPTPALARSWAWRAEARLVFSSAQAAATAAELISRSPNQRLATVVGPEVTAQLRHLDGSDLPEVLAPLAATPPVPLHVCVTTGRGDLAPTLREYAAQNPQLVLRVRATRDGKLELIATQPPGLWQSSLNAWLRSAKGLPPIQFTPQGQSAALVEWLLEFEPAGEALQWQDVAYSISRTRDSQSSPYRERFGDVLSTVPGADGKILVRYANFQGSAIAEWINFPIARASGGGADSNNHAVPLSSAGLFEVGGSTPRALVLNRIGEAQDGLVRRVRILPAPSPLALRAGLLTRSLDTFVLGESQTAPAQPALRRMSTPPTNRLMVFWNIESPPVADLRVRQALAAAVDPAELAARFVGPRARLAEGWFAPFVWFHTSGKSGETPAAEVDSLMPLAGWVKDQTGLYRSGDSTLTFHLLMTAGSPQRLALAQALAAQWRDFGAEVGLEEVDGDLMIDRLRRGQFDAALLGMDYAIDWDARPYWHSRSIGEGLNFSRLRDPQLDLQLDALALESDRIQVKARARATEERLLGHHAFLPLFTDLTQLALRWDRFPSIQMPSAGIHMKDLIQYDAAGSNQPPKMLMPHD